MSGIAGRMRQVAIAVAALLSACAGASDGDAVGTSRAAIIRGELDAPPRYDATVFLDADIGGGLAASCTGAVIAPHLVITARHCVTSYSEASGFGADYDPARIRVYYGAEPRRASPDNSGVRVVHNRASRVEDNDLALLVLKDAATVPPVAVRLARPPVMAEAVAAVGYGVKENEPAPSDLHPRYRRENLAVRYVGPIHTIGLGARELILGESICRGDSGGPLYAGETGALIAVASRGSNDQVADPSRPWVQCVGNATVNYYTRTDAFADLVRATAADLGETVLEERTAAETPEPSTSAPAEESSGCAMSARAEGSFGTLLLLSLVAVVVRRRRLNRNG